MEWRTPTITDAGPCLVWPGYRNRRGGYGQFKVSGRKFTVHRAVWEQAYGRIPAGREVMHWCDNPPCMNVAHLTVGTHAENMVGVGFAIRGGRNPSAKLTAEQVVAIRQDGRSMRAIGRDYGINASTVCRIKSGKKWGWL